MKDDFREVYAPVKLSAANAGVKQVEQGGTKHDEGKPRLSLVSRELIEELARVRAFGTQKYSKNNWRKGFKYSRSIDAALRHIAAFNSGEDLDSESGLSTFSATLFTTLRMMIERLDLLI
jgi:hypothetical protein